MKRVIIVIIAVMFLFTGFAAGQDCGKCPFKSKCLTEKKADAGKDGDSIVFVKKHGKYYHGKDCEEVKLEGLKLKLSEAVKRGLKPCEKCKKPVPPPPPKDKKKKQ